MNLFHKISTKLIPRLSAGDWVAYLFLPPFFAFAAFFAISLFIKFFFTGPTNPLFAKLISLINLYLYDVIRIKTECITRITYPPKLYAKAGSRLIFNNKILLQKILNIK
jgi:hypothetical protein